MAIRLPSAPPVQLNVPAAVEERQETGLIELYVLKLCLSSTEAGTVLLSLQHINEGIDCRYIGEKSLQIIL